MGKPKIKKPKESLETRQLKRLFAKLKAKDEPVLVPVVVESYSKPLQCYINVAMKIAKSGGTACYGWHIHQQQFIYEGEHHTVWRNEAGELIDVTPNQDNKKEILFVIDEDSYKGKDIPNVRINITDNAYIDDFILICETIDTLQAFSIRENEVKINIPTPIVQILNRYVDLKNAYWTYLKAEMHKQNLCICGSGLKYVKCHRPNLRPTIETDLGIAKQIFEKSNLND
ncbi:SEC-C domain-containing protein [Flavobacterium sp. 3-210]